MVADEGKMRQVLINLLGNAIKFTSRGQIKLHVTLQRRSPHRLWMSARVEKIRVRASPARSKARLFQPFNQFKRGPQGFRKGQVWGWPLAAAMPASWAAISRSRALQARVLFLFEIPIETDEADRRKSAYVPPPGENYSSCKVQERRWATSYLPGPEQLAELPSSVDCSIA